MVGGPSMFLTGNALAEELNVWNLLNLCKSEVSIVDGQLYLYPTCQSMSASLNTRLDYDCDTQSLPPRQTKPRFLRKLSFHTFN